MKKLFFIIPALMLALTATAQQARKDFKRDITLSASNYVAYPGPQKALTPAPGIALCGHEIPERKSRGTDVNTTNSITFSR